MLIWIYIFKVDSMSIGGNSGNSDSSTLKLEFRWDYLLIYTLLQIIKSDVSKNLREYLWDVIKKDMNEGTQVHSFQSPNFFFGYEYTSCMAV